MNNITLAPMSKQRCKTVRQKNAYRVLCALRLGCFIKRT